MCRASILQAMWYEEDVMAVINTTSYAVFYFEKLITLFNNLRLCEKNNAWLTIGYNTDKPG